MTASKLEESIEALANSLFRPDKGKWRRDDFIAGLKYFAEAVREPERCPSGLQRVDCLISHHCNYFFKLPKPPEAQKCKCVCHGQTGPMCWVCEEDKGCLKWDHKPAALPDEVVEKISEVSDWVWNGPQKSHNEIDRELECLARLCLRAGGKV